MAIAAPVGAALVSGGLGMFGGMQANSANREQFRTQMDFNERHARNGIKYRVEDLVQSGLNPILAAGNASNASAPGGHAAENVMEPLAAAAKDAVIMKQQADKNKEELNLIKAQTAATLATAKNTTLDSEEKGFWAEIWKSGKDGIDRFKSGALKPGRNYTPEQRTEREKKFEEYKRSPVMMQP